MRAVAATWLLIAAPVVALDDERLAPLVTTLDSSQPRTIAMMTTEALGTFHTEGERLAESLEPLLREKLEGAGHTVVGFEKTSQVFEDIRRAIGGIYDPITGELNADRRDHAWQHGLATLTRDYGAERILITQVFTLPIEMHGQNVAEWCNVIQSVYPEDGDGKPVRAGRGVTGVVNASCLLAELRDMSDVVQYRSFGGIELLMFMDGSYGVDRARSALFRDRSRIERAVDYALGPMLGEDYRPQRRPKRASPRVHIRKR